MEVAVRVRHLGLLVVGLGLTSQFAQDLIAISVLTSLVIVGWSLVDPRDAPSRRLVQLIRAIRERPR